jgi:hypothetical protein
MVRVRDGNQGSTAPEVMETQDLQHQRRALLTITPPMWICKVTFINISIGIDNFALDKECSSLVQ